MGVRWYLAVVTIIFPNDHCCLASFHALVGELYVSFGETPVFLPTLESDSLFLLLLSCISSFLKKNFFLIYLTALSLSCGMRDLQLSLWDLYS